AAGGLPTRRRLSASKRLSACPTRTRMKERLASARGVVHGAIALYGLYCSNYILALITVPYLVRVLGVEKWGLLAFSQSFCNYLVLVVELGFPYSATREAARNRDNPDRLSRLIAAVCSAKMMLGAACIAAGFIVERLVTEFRAEPLL